jgi:hypothetical protein
MSTEAERKAARASKFVAKNVDIGTREFWAMPRDMSDLMDTDQHIINGWTSRQVVRAHSLFMFPNQARSYQKWATNHPTADPRAYGPLADMAMSPDTPEANAVGVLSVADQVDAGTYGMVAGSNQSTPQAMDRTVTAAPQPDATDAWSGGLFKDALHIGGNIFGATAGKLSNEVPAPVKDVVRNTLTAASAPIEASTAFFRSAIGDEDATDKLLEPYGLSGDEKRIVLDTSARKDQGVASEDSMDFSGMGSGGAGAFGGSPKPTFESLSPERQKVVVEAMRVYDPAAAEKFKEFFPEVWSQTTLSQVVKDPALLTETVNAQTGAAERDKSWMPNKVAVRAAEQNAVKAYNITTLDEAARGISPTAWTWGRGVAHVWFDQDQTGFNAMSGTVDFGLSLTTDPMNLVPLGAVAKAPRLVGKGLEAVTGGKVVTQGLRTARAFEVGGDKVAVAVPTQRFTAAGRVDNPMAAAVRARPGASFTKVTDPITGVEKMVPRWRQAVDEGAEMVTDPALREVKDPETGLVSVKGGHSRYLMNKNAWTWLQTGRGARVVDALANERSAGRIWLQSNRKIDMDLAKQLADADNPAAIRAILGTRMGAEIHSLDDLGAIGRGPTMFKQVLGGKYGEAGSLLDSGGLLTQAGRAATKANFDEFGIVGAVGGLGRRSFRKTPNTGAGVDLEDLDHTAVQFERWMRGSRLYDADETAAVIDRLANASTGAQRYEIIYGKGGMLEDAAKKLVDEHGIEKGYAQRLTRAFQGGMNAEERMWMDQDLLDGTSGAVARTGDVGKPLLESEQLSRVALLPDYRAMVRTTGSLSKIERQFRRGTLDDTQKITRARNASADFMFSATSRWRESVLIRPAYVFREIGEMAMAMSLSGYQGAFTHPAKFMTNMFVATQAQHANRVFSKLLKETVSGGKISQKTAYEYLAHSEAMARLMPGLDLNQARIIGRSMYDNVNKIKESPDPGKMLELRDALSDAMGAVVGNKMLDASTAKAGSRGVAVALRDDLAHRNMYVNALGEKLRKAWTDRDMRNMADPDMDAAQRLEAFQAGTKPMKQEMRPDLLDGSNARDEEYLDLYKQMLQRVTVGQSDLLDVVKTGQFNGKPAFIHKADGTQVISRELQARLNELLEDPNIANQLPNALHYLDQKAFLGRTPWANMTSWFFDSTAELSDVFARGPLFRQAYATRVKELVPEMTQQAKTQAVRNLRRAGDVKLAREIQAIPASKHGTLGVDEVEGIAMGFAGRESRRVFYDAHERQNYALAARTIAPFAQATFNTFRRWGQMSLQNPQMMYRTAKPMIALNDPGSAAIYDIASAAFGGEASEQYFTPGRAEGNVDGFFFTDQYGDRKFAFPGVGNLVSLIPGAPDDFQAIGSAGGLNVAGQTTNPGMGPTLTFAASMFASQTVYEDSAQGQVMRYLFPYPLSKGSFIEKAYNSFSPTWARKVQAATDEEHIAGTSVRIMGVLAASGEYDLTNSGERRRMANDATQLAGRLSIADAMMSWLLPTSGVSTQSQQVGSDALDDPNTPVDEAAALRRVMLQDRLMVEFRKYTEDDYNQGVAQFVEDYGRNALFAVLPTTTSASGDDLPAATNDIWEFRSSEPDAYSEYAPVLGLFFAGDNPVETFSKELYGWQRAGGERVKKTGLQAQDSVNNAMGWMIWEQQSKAFDVDQTGWNEAQRDALQRQRSQTKDAIMAQFPGWTGTQTDPSEFPKQMDRLKDAVEDERIQTLPSTKFIADYLATRDDAIESLRNRTGSSDLSTIEAGPEREMLLSVASRFNREEKSGGFHNAWIRLLSDEFGEEF